MQQSETRPFRVKLKPFHRRFLHHYRSWRRLFNRRDALVTAWRLARITDRIP